jgi:hypothetical protein
MYYLHLESWAGRTKKPVEILKETPTRYKVKLLADCMKGKKDSILYVPKNAITKD